MKKNNIYEKGGRDDTTTCYIECKHKLIMMITHKNGDKTKPKIFKRKLIHQSFFTCYNQAYLQLCGERDPYKLITKHRQKNKDTMVSLKSTRKLPSATSPLTFTQDMKQKMFVRVWRKHLFYLGRIVVDFQINYLVIIIFWQNFKFFFFTAIENLTKFTISAYEIV